MVLRLAGKEGGMTNGASSSNPPVRLLAAAAVSLVTVLLVGLVGMQPAAAHHGQQLGGRQPAPATPATPTPANPFAPAPGQAAPQQPLTASLGSTGDHVRKIEERLRALHYFVGAVDGTFDKDTEQAVNAMQKVHGMDVTGRVDAQTWSTMSTAKDPSPLVPGGAERRVEIDVRRQVLFLYEGNKLAEIVPVSTGSEEPYCENGSCGDAVTPRGDFNIYRQGFGWEVGPLGALYNPSYFKAGFAVHGSESVPNYPASHGCVRIPMSVAEWFPQRAPMGTPVHVRG